MINLYMVILLKAMWMDLPLMLANIMREEEIRALLMILLYFKFKLLIILRIGYHQVAATYSYIKCQCIGRELDLNVIVFMFCGVIHMLSFTIQFEQSYVSL